MFLVGALVLIAAAAVGGDLPQPLRVPGPEERATIRGREEYVPLAPSAGAGNLSPGVVIDVERYIIDLAVSLAPNRVDGTVQMEIRAISTISQLQIGLYDELQVSAVNGPIGPLPFTHGGNVIQVTLDRIYQPGELILLDVTYGGLPPVVGYGSFRFDTHAGAPMISSLSEPSFAPSWWPCLDDPADKALVEMNLTVPDTLVGVSNGTLDGIINGPGSTDTYRWRTTTPISTYLVSVAISNYLTWTDTYTPVTGGAPMPVQHWVYPEHLSAAQQDLSVTIPMLQVFSTLFGEYPFVDEKYGHAIFRFGGGMEHQTVTSYGATLIRGDNFYDWVVAHELAHQWWGDSVGPADWREIWLNEGFATYSEALWTESLGGTAALQAYMAGLDSRPFCGPVYDPTCGLFTNTVYDKGAWVLHMLRRIMGDVPFIQGLKDYAQTHRHGHATTVQMREVMEAASGLSLSSFFGRWVLQTGEPSYQWGWSAVPTPAGWVTYVQVDQIQGGMPFAMPIDLRLSTAAGDVDVVLDSNQVQQLFVLSPLPQQPTAAVIDPELWLLKTEAQVTLADGDADLVPDAADNCALAPNPLQEDLDSDGAGDACDPDVDGDGTANASDCAPANPLLADLPSEATGLDVMGQGGTADLAWDPAVEPVGYEVLRGLVRQLQPAGTGAAACLLTGLTQPSASDAQVPPAEDGFYYLIRATNGCGPGPAGNASTGAPRAIPACP